MAERIAFTTVGDGMMHAHDVLEEVPMGFMDKIKGLIGKEPEKTAVAVDKAKDAVDKASDVVEKKVGTEHAPKVEAAAEKAKDAIDKIDD